MSRLLHTAITERANARPEGRAILMQDGGLTYGELEVASNRLARMLRELDCRRGDRVALLMPKAPAAIAGLIGVLKADAAYVPLDPSGPPTRLARILETCDCHSILASGKTATLLRETLACANLERRPLVGWLDGAAPQAQPAPAFTAADLDSLPATTPASVNRDTDLAHILFTSGSTGVPKGVMITHYSVMRLLEWATGYFGICAADRASQHAPLHFDISTFDIFATLGAGAELHLIPPALNLLPHKLAQLMRRSRLTQWFSVPSVLNLMAKFDAVEQGDFPELRRVLWAGEVLPTPTLIHWMRRLPHARFTNLYGPTETTIVSSHYTVPHCPASWQEPVPIGSACAGEELLILDSTMRPVAPGETGDLYIRGVGLSPGYWRDPKKTDGVFLPYRTAAGSEERIYRTGDLARVGTDGLIYFAGRRDYQIKSRGYRIELGEIETALNALPELRESAVVAVQSEGFEGWMICCAYVPVRGHSLDPQHVRRSLARVLPGYMLPAHWMRCDALPRNANGKTDRPVLRRRFLEAKRAPSEAGARAASISGRL